MNIKSVKRMCGKWERENMQKWHRLTEISESWISQNYANAKAVDNWKYHQRLDTFFEWLGLTDAEFLEGYKIAEDKTEWARKTGLKLLEYYKTRIGEGYKINTVRADTSTVRAFCRDNAITLILKRKAIAKPQASTDEHEFLQEELVKMYAVASVRDKAILACGVSLGYGMKDFLSLKRDFIEPFVQKAISEKIDFIGFNYARSKTQVSARSHLTPEARDSLAEWFKYVDKARAEKGLAKSEWVWCNGNETPLTDDAINGVIKDLCKKANIQTTGKIHFHLLRKFLMGAFGDAKIPDFITKKALGKEINVSDATYLQHLVKNVDKTFPRVYPYIRLVGVLNHNGQLKIEMLEQRIVKQEGEIKRLLLENEVLRSLIPKETFAQAIRSLAEKYGIEEGVRKTIFTVDDLMKAIETKPKEAKYKITVWD
jgi:site-specific recombinase XerD